MHVQTFWAVNLNILSLEIFIKIWTEVTVSAQLQIVNWMTTDSSFQLVVPRTHAAGSKLHCQTPTKHTKNITSNFSHARSTIPEDGSQRIRNMSEFLIVF